MSIKENALALVLTELREEVSKLKNDLASMKEQRANAKPEFSGDLRDDVQSVTVSEAIFTDDSMYRH